MKKLLFLLCIFAYSQLFSQVTVTLDPETEYQTIAGFGAHGSMNVWWSSGPFYNSAFLDLIVDDLGLTINRNEYYPDGGDVFNNKQVGWINALKDKAAASGEPIKFITTYWSPPAAWKSNNSTIEGGSLLPQYYDDFANYCVSTVNDYKTECGVDLYGLSIANEPRFEEPYNSSVWEPEQYAEVVTLVGEALDNAGLNTQTFGPEDMGAYATNTPWLQSVLDENFESRKYMDIWAVHGYLDGVAADLGDAPGWTAMSERTSKYNKQIWMTETSGYDESWPGGAFDLAKSIYLALEYGNVSAWVWWQLCEGSSNVYNLLVNGVPTKRYYSSKHYYRYIRPGAKHIKSTSSDPDILVTAFKHPEDGRLTIILINNSSSSKTVNLDMGSYNVPGTFQVYRTSSSENCIDAGTVSNNTFNLPAESLNTLVFESSDHGPSIDQVDHTILLSTAGQQTVNLTGIDDGGDGGQSITVSAISSDPLIIPNPTVTYTSPNTTATLNYTPQAGSSGEVTITVIVSDDGDDSGDLNVKRMHFDVLVLPFVNAAPTIDAVADFKVGTNASMESVILTGISDGNDGSQLIDISAESAVPGAIEVAAIYTQGSDELTLYYNTNTIEYTIPITITLVDDGGVDLGGVNTKTITFNITIEDGYGVDPPEGLFVGDATTQVFPNPAQEFLNIVSTTTEFDQVRIFDNLGRTIRLEDYDSKINTSQIKINNIEKGVYFIQLYNNKQKVYTTQFIKE